MGFPHECGGSWLMPLQGHSWESLLVPGNCCQEFREGNIIAIHKSPEACTEDHSGAGFHAAARGGDHGGAGGPALKKVVEDPHQNRF